MRLAAALVLCSFLWHGDLAFEAPRVFSSTNIVGGNNQSHFSCHRGVIYVLGSTCVSIEPGLTVRPPRPGKGGAS